jgi:hypothetical protein
MDSLCKTLRAAILSIIRLACKPGIVSHGARR